MVYSHRDLKEEMERVSREYCGGGTPTKREMKKHGEISESTYYRIFGSWNEAVKECGFEINEVYTEIEREYSKSELESELKKLSSEIRDGGTPRYVDVVKHSEIPNSVFLNRFGSWNEALKSCGFSVNIKFRSKEEIKKKMIELSSEMNKTPGAKEFYDKTGISDKLVQEKFGKWNSFVQECGLERNLIHDFSREELLEEIQNLYSKENRVPTIDILKDKSEYSLHPFLRVFGTWNNAIRSAGLEPQPQIASGEDHVQWKGGVSEVWYGSSWSKRREQAFERDGGYCRLCGNSEKRIEVHHITPKRFWNVDEEHEKMNHPRNLISLCKICHAKFESSFKGRNHEEFEELAKKSLNT